MFMVNHLVGFGAIQSALTSTPIAQATGTVIGDMTGDSGIAALFDGTKNTTSPTGTASKATSPGYGGKQWSAAKILSRVVIYSNSNVGIVSSGTVQITVRGSNDGSSWTTLYDASGLSAGGGVNYDITASSLVTTTGYTYHSVLITGTATLRCTEIEFEEYL